MGHVAHSRSTWPHGKWVSLATPSQKTITHLFLHLRTSRLVIKIANRLHVGEVVQTCKEYAQSVRLGDERTSKASANAACKVRTQHVITRDQCHDNFSSKSLARSLLVWCLTRPSLWGFQFVSSFFCVADHWLTSPQLLDHSDQRDPFSTAAIAWSCHECPGLALTHSPLVSRLRATSNAPPVPAPPYTMLRVLQWGLSQPPPAGSMLVVPLAARPWKGQRSRPESDDH